MNSQEQAFEKLSRLKCGALFMEMGTGKTKVALDLIASKADKINAIVWVCPYSLKGEIELERQKWHPELDLLVVGYESIGSSDRIYMDLLDYVQAHKTFIVADESLKIKNVRAKRTARLIEIGQYCKYRLILNGTPISKNCLDLWAQMEFLSPKILKMDYRKFKNTFCEYYVRGKLKGLVKGQCNIPYLISLVEPYVFDASLDIEAKKSYYDYSYYNDNYEEYQQIKEDLLYSIPDEELTDIDVMRLFTMLQVCYTKSSSKFMEIDSITESTDEQYIVFVKFLSGIKDKPHICGDMPEAERQQVLEDFRAGKIKVLYLTYGVGAYGLNLQCCHNVIFADQTFDYAQKIQAEARIYRKGQESNVRYFNLWCDCGLEEIIRRSLSKKTGLLQDVKREIQSKKGGVKEWLKTI